MLNLPRLLQVRVRRRGHDQKFLAQVLAVGVECDIALLTVEDPAFWEDVQPLKFGPLPRLQVGAGFMTYSTAVSMQTSIESHCNVEPKSCSQLGLLPGHLQQAAAAYAPLTSVAVCPPPSPTPWVAMLSLLALADCSALRKQAWSRALLTVGAACFAGRCGSGRVSLMGLL